MQKFIETLFADPQMLRMGHGQRADDNNLGMGWLYYAFGRLLRPQKSLVIGSWRGFAPSVMAKSQLDNLESGELIFIDPSLADDFWADPAVVTEHFDRLATPNVVHHRCTTQEFVTGPAYQTLGDIGLLMIDGLHTAEQARFDYLAFCDKLTDDAVTLFHDSVWGRESSFYGKDKAYEHSVHQLMDRLRETAGLEVFSLPLASGLTLVRGRPQSLDAVEQPFD